MACAVPVLGSVHVLTYNPHSNIEKDVLLSPPADKKLEADNCEVTDIRFLMSKWKNWDTGK